MFKRFLEGYFGFNKQQRNGLLVLAFISFILLIVRIVFPYFIHPAEIEIKNLPLLPIEKSLADSSQQFAAGSWQFSDSSKRFAPDNVKTNLFVFNPNTVSYEQLLQLGFKDKTAKTFIKYRSKGFQFKHKEDLKKVYGLNEALYKTLEPYIQIESTQSKKEKAISKNKTITKIEINAADTQQLLTISIIDLSAAKRILKYRDKLGGFASFNQLNEVYGFDAKYCDKLKSHFEINPVLIKKINPNKATFQNLDKHPYINEELAKQIVANRKKIVFNLNNFAELINDKELFEKLKPYLTFD